MSANLAKEFAKAAPTAEQIELGKELLREVDKLHPNVQRALELIRAGADLEQKDHMGNTPLLKSSFFGHSKIVKALLAEGADIGHKNDLGETAVIFAARGNNPDVLQELIDRNAPVNDRFGGSYYTALHVAAEFEFDEIMRLLLKVRDINLEAHDEFGNTPLLVAAYKGYFSIVKLLAIYGADLYAENQGGADAVSRARLRNFETVAAYIEKKREVKFRAKPGSNPSGKLET